MRFALRRRTIVGTLVSHSALWSVRLCIYVHIRTVYARIEMHIYLHVCPRAHNCGWLLYVLNAPCKATVFQLAATPDGVIVPASATRFGFLKRRLYAMRHVSVRRALQIRLTLFVHARTSRDMI